MSLIAVSGSAWPKSPPLLWAALVRREAPLSLILAPRTAFAVHPRPATYGPLSETSTSPPRSMAADSMPSTPRKHLSRCAPPALSFRSRAGRCGCDSLSLAGSRQRVKSQASAVNFNIPLHPQRGTSSCSPDPLQKCVPFPLPLHTRCAPVPCPLHSPHIFRGLAEQRDCSFRSGVRSSHRRSSHRLAKWYPYRDEYVGPIRSGSVP